MNLENLDSDVTVGTKFSSYDDVCLFIKSFEKKNFVELSVYMSKRLSSATVMKKYKDRIEHINKKLVYYNITYCCTHGGKYRNNNATLHARKTRYL